MSQWKIVFLRKCSIIVLNRLDDLFHFLRILSYMCRPIHVVSLAHSWHQNNFKLEPLNSDHQYIPVTILDEKTSCRSGGSGVLSPSAS